MDGYDITPPPDRLSENAQIRYALTTEKGKPIRFVAQLEYWLDGGWKEVVRYDHDKYAKGGHDITSEGLHRDVFRDGEKYEVVEVTGPIPAGKGFDAAEEDLHENVQRYIERFETWHNITQRDER